MKIKFFPILFFALSALCYQDLFAAIYTSTTNGNWNAASTWGGAGTPTDGDVVIIKHNVTLTSASYTWYAAASSIIIQEGGKLTRTGNLTLTGEGFEIILTKQGTFVVTGNLVMTNKPTLTTNETGTGTGAVVTIGGSLNIGDGTQISLSSSAKATIGTSATAVNLTLQSSGETKLNSAGSIAVTGSVSNSKSFSNSGVVTVSGTYTNEDSGASTENFGSMTIGTLVVYATVSNSGTMSLTNFNAANGTFTNTGQTTVSTLTTLSGGSVQLSPGASASSRFTVAGTLNMTAWGNVVVGNGVPSGTPAKYADLVVEGNVQDNAGHITVDCNGRVAIFGDLNLNNWPNFTIKKCSATSGGQVYVDGDGTGNSVTATQGHVNNQNSSPYGLYVNGPTTGDVSPAAASISTMQSTNPSFYDWVSKLPNSPLPVKLQYFKIVGVAKEGISLEWATSMEKNFSHFELQRAGSDLEFTAIGILEGRGGLQVKTVYDFTDDAPQNGKNYYRLKAIDFDGSAEYFSVIVADWNISQGLSLYPNPTVDLSFTVDIGDEFDHPVTLVVYDTRGYTLYTTDIDVSTKTIGLPANTKPGIYFVKIASSSRSQVVRLVVN